MRGVPGSRRWVRRRNGRKKQEVRRLTARSSCFQANRRLRTEGLIFTLIKKGGFGLFIADGGMLAARTCMLAAIYANILM